MTTTMWAVSSGSYSDYGVACVCANKAVAKAVAAKMGRDYDVEEFPFLLSVDGVYTEINYYVGVDEDGRELTGERCSYVSHVFTFTLPPSTEDVTLFKHGPFVAMGRSTRSYDHALKAARDKLGQIKAERAGIAS